jgi:hypothetical protein
MKYWEEQKKFYIEDEAAVSNSTAVNPISVVEDTKNGPDVPTVNQSVTAVANALVSSILPPNVK